MPIVAQQGVRSVSIMVATTALGPSNPNSVQSISTFANALAAYTQVYVVDEGALYIFDPTSMANPLPGSVILPGGVSVSGPGRWVLLPSASGGGSVSRLLNLAVNAASADLFAPPSADNYVVLRTGARSNAAGAYNGGGAGNKAILGVLGFNGLPIADLVSLSYTWENLLGPGGPFFIPPSGPSVQTPYLNLVVDFGGDIRVLALCDDSLNGAISNSIGSYLNNGSNVMTYSWDSSMNALIVLAPPNAVPGGVAPAVSVGAAWPENSYRWSDLVAANPGAVLIDAFPADGGLPAGAVVPAVLLVSGDSGNVVKSGKRIAEFSVNGDSVL
jgi:hypothetical protein